MFFIVTPGLLLPMKIRLVADRGRPLNAAKKQLHDLTDIHFLACELGMVKSGDVPRLPPDVRAMVTRRDLARFWAVIGEYQAWDEQTCEEVKELLELSTGVR